MKNLAKFLIVCAFLALGVVTYHLHARRGISPFTQYAALIPGTYRVGFTNVNAELENVPLNVEGTIPTWLAGTLLRNGPAQFYTTNSWVADWFDGLAMIHAFTIDNGAVRYSNKFLHSQDYEHVQKTGNMNYAGFAQDPCGSRFKKFIAAFFPACDTKISAPNANVNIAQYTDRFIALTELPLPIEFDPQTLHTLGVYDYQDPLPKKDIHDTAHPHYDPENKKHYGYFTAFGKESTLHLFSIADGTSTREIVASLPFKEPSYMHSFAITKNYAIFTALPLVVRPLDLLSGKPFIQNYRWEPERGTKIIVINRHTGGVVREFNAKPFFAFHTVNAFEQDDDVLLDIVLYDDAQGLAQATFDTLLAPEHERVKHPQLAEPDAEHTEGGALTRFTMNTKTGQVAEHQLSSILIELPRINYTYNGKPYTYAYGFAQSSATRTSYVADQLVKINIKTGQHLIWQEPLCYPGEAVFIARPGGTQEDDGVVASVVLNAKTGTSFLLILDAHTFTELARAQLPHHIPFGIHGQFFSGPMAQG